MEIKCTLHEDVMEGLYQTEFQDILRNCPDVQDCMASCTAAQASSTIGVSVCELCIKKSADLLVKSQIYREIGWPMPEAILIPGYRISR